MCHVPRIRENEIPKKSPNSKPTQMALGKEDLNPSIKESDASPLSKEYSKTMKIPTGIPVSKHNLI
jgi:hypothetical protein